MPSKRCPNCDLTNPASAVRCDCGYDFPSGQVAESYAPPPAHPRRDPMQDIVVGGGFCALGVVFTAATYAAAPKMSGVYIVAWGPIVFGAFQLLRGLTNLGNRR